MANLLTTGLAIHAAALSRAAGEPITYQESDYRIELTGIRGQTDFEQDANDGEVRILAKFIDWIVKRDDMSLAGSLFEPKPGAQIWTPDGQVFDVRSGPHGSCFSWLSGHRTHYRIHSVQRRDDSIGSQTT